MENKNDVQVKNAVVWVRYAVSQKTGNPYKYFEIAVNGKMIRLGFCGDREELQLLKAGVQL